MTSAEIKAVLEHQFPAAMVENEDLTEKQVELKGNQWLEIATFIKMIQTLALINWNALLDMIQGRMVRSRRVIISIPWNTVTRSKWSSATIVKNPNVASIEQLWRIGDWFERETYDMFGIVYEGHRGFAKNFMS